MSSTDTGGSAFGPESGSLAHVMVRNLPFVPVLTDPRSSPRASPVPRPARSGWPSSSPRCPRSSASSSTRPLPRTQTSFHADVLAGVRAQMRGEIPARTTLPRARSPLRARPPVVLGLATLARAGVTAVVTPIRG